jgi:hypothetical protein
MKYVLIFLRLGKLHKQGTSFQYTNEIGNVVENEKGIKTMKNNFTFAKFVE